jgi:hypothetical protein
VWEEGACRERPLWIIWSQPDETRVANAGDSFLAGTGYNVVGYCQQQ